MWTRETSLCRGCGAEITLFTDGRIASASTSWVDDSRSHERDLFAETTEVWRDGLSLVTACPTVRMPENIRCDSEVVFIGEGKSIPLSPADAEPILESRP